MTKQDLLKRIARNGYNVGFGAKKNFATFDIVSKLPGWVSLTSLAVGIFALFHDELGTKNIVAAFIVFGISTMYISFYDNDKNKYESAGIKQTKIFNELEKLYYTAKSQDLLSYDEIENKMSDLMDDFYSSTISKQIFGSNWYAHYKFFTEFEKRWVEDELKLRLFRDKIPKSFIFIIIISILTFLYFH